MKVEFQRSLVIGAKNKFFDSMCSGSRDLGIFPRFFLVFFISKKKKKGPWIAQKRPWKPRKKRDDEALDHLGDRELGTLQISTFLSLNQIFLSGLVGTLARGQALHLENSVKFKTVD